MISLSDQCFLSDCLYLSLFIWSFTIMYVQVWFSFNLFFFSGSWNLFGTTRVQVLENLQSSPECIFLSFLLFVLPLKVIDIVDVNNMHWTFHSIINDSKSYLFPIFVASSHVLDNFLASTSHALILSSIDFYLLTLSLNFIFQL